MNAISQQNSQQQGAPSFEDFVDQFGMMGSNEMNPNAAEFDMQNEEEFVRPQPRNRNNNNLPSGRHLSAKSFFNDAKEKAKEVISNMVDEAEDQWDEFKNNNSDNFDSIEEDWNELIDHIKEIDFSNIK